MVDDGSVRIPERLNHRAEVLAVWRAPFGIERFAAAGNRIVMGGSKGRVVFLTLEE